MDINFSFRSGQNINTVKTLIKNYSANVKSLFYQDPWLVMINIINIHIFCSVILCSFQVSSVQFWKKKNLICCEVNWNTQIVWLLFLNWQANDTCCDFSLCRVKGLPESKRIFIFCIDYNNPEKRPTLFGCKTEDARNVRFNLLHISNWK